MIELPFRNSISEYNISRLYYGVGKTFLGIYTTNEVHSVLCILKRVSCFLANK